MKVDFFNENEMLYFELIMLEEKKRLMLQATQLERELKIREKVLPTTEDKRIELALRAKEIGYKYLMAKQFLIQIEMQIQEELKNENKKHSK